MYTYEEYSQQSTLSSYMTGTMLGFIKWSDMNDKNKKHLAKQLLWCYEKSGAPLSDSIKKELEDIVSK